MNVAFGGTTACACEIERKRLAKITDYFTLARLITAEKWMSNSTSTATNHTVRNEGGKM